MKKSKLLGLLQTLNSKELRAFKDFVESPFFNKQESLIRMYAYLKKWAPQGFPDKKVDRAVVFQKLFPGKAYDDKEMNYQMSQLLKLAEKFIGLRKIEESGVLADCYTLSSYLDRRLEKQYKHVLNRASLKMEGIQQHDEEFYYQKYMLSNIAERHFALQNQRKFDKHLQEAADNLDIFYYTKKMKYLCIMLDRQKYLSRAYDLHLLEETKRAIPESIYRDIPSISIYFSLLQTLTEEDSEPHFLEFKALIFQHGAQFSIDEMQDLYYFAINYCIQKIRIGQKQFAEELMNLYQDGLEKKYLLQQGKLSPWTFKNMAKLGLGLGRYDWVGQFVMDYNTLLPEEARSDAIHFNLADLHYHKKDFEQAMQHLNQVEFKDIHYNLGAKVMLLKIYYENNTTEAFLSLVSSFKVFVKRNKLLSGNVKTPYLNFVEIIHQLHKYGTKDPEAIRQKIDNTKMLSDRTWLVKQLP